MRELFVYGKKNIETKKFKIYIFSDLFIVKMFLFSYFYDLNIIF